MSTLLRLLPAPLPVCCRWTSRFLTSACAFQIGLVIGLLLFLQFAIEERRDVDIAAVVARAASGLLPLDLAFLDVGLRLPDRTLNWSAAVSPVRDRRATRCRHCCGCCPRRFRSAAAGPRVS